MSNQEIAWDLSVVFPSTTDPAINTFLYNLESLADKLEKNYKGKISNLSADGLLKLLQEYEQYIVDNRSISLFARLSFAANMTLPDTQTLNDRVSKTLANLNKKLAFMDLEIGQLVYSKSNLITNEKLSNYKHYLERLYRQVPHQLSEIEEQIIIEKDQYGIRGWQELQSKWLNTRIFNVEVEGEMKQLSYGEANSLLPHPDRGTRKSAYESIYTLLKSDGDLYASALRNICNDWINIVKRRNFESEIHASLISNDTEQKIISSLLQAIDEGSHVFRRYLKIKAKILGLPILVNYDVVAPFPDAPNKGYDWLKAKELVIEAYSKFDDEYATATREMFEKNCIDASPRFGKRNGAFCSNWYKGKSAFILQSFNNALSGVYTLAHELGHATHDYYFNRDQTILNGSIPMVSAETASTFGELLLTDLLLNKAKSNEEKIAILMQVLDGAGFTAFQVSARAWFEQDLYDAIKRGEFLDYETISKYWTKNRDRIYGDAIEWLDVMDSEWTMKTHYYLSNFRFYNYPYVYGQLFVYALYQKYLEEGKEFVPKFKKILAAGSILSPKDLGKLLGLDVTNPEFWTLGIKQFEYFVDELEKLVM